MDQTIKKIDQTIKEMNQTIKKIDQTIKEMNQTIKKIDQTIKEIDQTIKEIDQRLTSHKVPTKESMRVFIERIPPLRLQRRSTSGSPPIRSTTGHSLKAHSGLRRRGGRIASHRCGGGVVPFKSMSLS
jgi:predicted ribosome quality control (RQC) complex YloA/Tae2 family protein